jgi:hypothetical protein
MSLAAKGRYLHIIILATGWLLGYLPVIDTWQEADPLDAHFRLLVLPPLLGLLSWLIWCGLTFLIGRQKPAIEHLGQRSMSAVKDWLRIIPARWPYFVIVLLLGLLAYHQYGAYTGATSQLHSYLSSLRQDSGTGYLATRHSFSNWCTPALTSKIAPRINFSSDADPEYRAIDYGMRYLSMFYLEQKKDLAFELNSDDGSILLIDGLRIINNLGRHPVQVRTAKIGLDKGWHSLEVLYFQAGGGAQIRLEVPPEIGASMKPVSSQVNVRKVWLLSRVIQTSHNRFNILFWSACTLFILLLLPYPKFSARPLVRWIASHLPLLGLMALSGLLLSFRLDLFPGILADEALVGDSGFSKHWYGITNADMSEYAWSDFSALLIEQLQKVFLLSVFSLRIVPIILNLAGLFLCGLGLEKLVSRRSGLIVVLLIGTAPFFLGISRLILELLLSSTFVLGACLYGLALVRNSNWPGLIMGALLGFGMVLHVWWLHFIAGFGLALVIMLRFKLLKSWAFWLGLAGLALVGHEVLAMLLFGDVHNPTGGVDLGRALTVAVTSLTQGMPWLLSGDMVMKVLNGEPLMPIYPVVPLIMLALLIYWPFAKLGREYNRALAWAVIAACGSFLALAVLSPMIKAYYFVIILALCLIWLAIYLDGLWSRGLVKVALPLVLLTAVYSGAVFLINGPLNYNPPVVSAYQLKRHDPAKGFWNNSQHYFFQQELYDFLANLGRPVVAPNVRLGGPLWFLERSDSVGRRGYLMSKYLKGSVAVYFADYDMYHRGELRKRCQIEATGPKVRKRVELPSHLADKFVAYILLQDIDFSKLPPCKRHFN